MLASVIVSAIVYFLTIKDDPMAWKNFKIILYATALTLGAFALWHLFRAPWLVHSHVIKQKEAKDHWLFGALGICVMAAIIVAGCFLASYIMGGSYGSPLCC